MRVSQGWQQRVREGGAKLPDLAKVEKDLLTCLPECRQSRGTHVSVSGLAFWNGSWTQGWNNYVLSLDTSANAHAMLCHTRASFIAT